METFHKLFASLLTLIYHGFDRVVIQGYLPLLTPPEHIVYFFRDLHGIYPITKQALRQRTRDYQHWVEAFARNHRIPLQWPDPDRKKKGLRQEDYVRPYLLAMERRQRFGVYFIFKTMEPGPNFRSCPPKYPTQDPDYRIIKRQWSRYTHYYFYLRDEVLGPMILCVGSFLPFQTRYWINGHSFIAGELQRQGLRFHKDDNAFLSVSDPEALQATADRLSPRSSASAWTTGLWSWVPSSPRRSGPPSTCGVSIGSIRSSTVSISFFGVTFLSTRSLSAPPNWVSSASPPTRSRRSSGCASTSGCLANCTVCWNASIMGTMYCGSIAKTW